MAQQDLLVSALRPSTGTLSKMVGSSALALVAQLKSGGLTQTQLQEVTGEAIRNLQDQLNAWLTLSKLNQQTVTVNTTGTGNTFVLSTAPTITNATLVTPTIASFVNATHNHQNAAGGGLLDAAAVPTGTFAQESWTTDTLLNSWVTGALTGDATASYRKDRNGVVWSRGAAKNGTTADGTTIFTLGAGYRPTSTVRIPATAQDVTPAFIAAPAILRIDVNGNVDIYSAPAGTVYIQLDFSFPTS